MQSATEPVRTLNPIPRRRIGRRTGILLLACSCHGSNQPAGVAPAHLDWSPVREYLDSAIAAGAAPGAVLGVSYAGHHFYYGTGRLGQDDATRPDSLTLYDLASVTKVVGLTTTVMLAVNEGKLSLDDTVSQLLPAFSGAGKAGVTIRHLLTHSSGLPGWHPLYKETTTRAEAMAMADTIPLDTVPGTRFVYSDLGAIVLTQVVERLYGERIDSLLQQRVFGPLGLSSTRYLPPAAWIPRIAPTENDPWRGRVLRGEVHDENASRLDGVSGHAGLFSDATDLLAFADWMLSGVESAAPAENQPALASDQPKFLGWFTAPQNIPPGSSRALGWDTPSGISSSGTKFRPGSFGHTGFTGTSIWVDPSRRLAIVLLSNRVHPTRENQRWTGVRGAVADLVVGVLEPAAR
ncbi:MAG: serine hydrolase domain-containing protein [Gemmatimonadota bacterium]